MLTVKDRTIAEQFKARLLEAGIAPLEYVVFGSRARGDNDEYSDLDLFVVVKDLTADMKKHIVTLAWEVGFENSMPIVPIICTEERLSTRAYQELPLLEALREEGIAL